MQTIQIEAEGHYCLNPACGADSDHLSVSLSIEDNAITVACFECRFVGTET